jgi:hypothetical protein
MKLEGEITTFGRETKTKPCLYFFFFFFFFFVFFCFFFFVVLWAVNNKGKQYMMSVTCFQLLFCFVLFDFLVPAFSID